MSSSLNLIKTRQKREIRKTGELTVTQRVQHWVLVQSPVTQSKQPLFYNGASSLNYVYLVSDINNAPWYQSKHHANSALTFEMKHAGFIACPCSDFSA